jgi:hypothetical protein
MKEFAADGDMTYRATQHWVQSEGISWNAVRHSIAFLDLVEGGWWDDSYDIHPEEPLVKYHKLYCSAWGVMLRKDSIKRLSHTFYKYVEVGFYNPPNLRVTLRGKQNGKPYTELLHNIIGKCFLGKTDNQRVKFKNGNSYDCHIYNLYLEDKTPKTTDSPKDDLVLDEWECKQCKACITSPDALYFRHDTIFCGENCADVFEEDLKFVDVKVDSEDEDWYHLEYEN